MPKFEGKYYDESGAVQAAVVEADHKYEARDAIRALGGIVSLRQVGEAVEVTHAGSGDEDTDSSGGETSPPGQPVAGASGDDGSLVDPGAGTGENSEPDAA